jgi:hypothetical protein
MLKPRMFELKQISARARIQTPSCQRATQLPKTAKEHAMTPSERWEQIAESGEFDLLDQLLADDVIFESPIVHTPQVGRAITKAYLIAAVKVLGGPDARFVNRWFGERSAVLELETRIDGLTINGVDIISWNPEGQITHFKVMIRPLQAINALHQAMGRQLAPSRPAAPR